MAGWYSFFENRFRVDFFLLLLLRVFFKIGYAVDMPLWKGGLCIGTHLYIYCICGINFRWIRFFASWKWNAVGYSGYIRGRTCCIYNVYLFFSGLLYFHIKWNMSIICIWGCMSLGTLIKTSNEWNEPFVGFKYEHLRKGYLTKHLC